MFKDRVEAGKRLAEKLKADLGVIDPRGAVVLGIPRGGLAISKEINLAFQIPFDCLIIKKIPAPENKELAIGAVGEGGVVVWEEKICRDLEVTTEYKQEIVKKKIEEFEKKENDFRLGKDVSGLKGKSVIIVDDGIATGATIKAAVAVVKNFSPKEIIIAVPVIALETLPEIKKIVDRVIYLEAPEMFFSLDQFYEDFRQLTDEEARNILASSV